MNDQELKNRLSKFTVPPADPSAQGKALHRATTALVNAEVGQEEIAPTNSRRWIAWTLISAGVATAIFMVVSVISVSEPAQPPVIKNQVTDAAKTLRQMEAVFPGQINAIIESNHDVDVELAENPSAPSEQPLIVNFKSAAESIQVLSYSGRRICVELNGQRTCFEAILTSDGGVILSGQDFVWTPQNPTKIAGHSIEARQLIPNS